MTSGYEKRRFYRSTVNLPVMLDFGGDRVAPGTVANLSLVGMYVVAETPAAVNSDCSALLNPGPSGDPVSVRGRVMHQDKAGMGIEITGIESASFQPLQALIVEHAEDSFNCEAETVTNMAFIPPLY